MFKNFTYKIIAIVGLLAGMFGPQIASGTELPAQPAGGVSIVNLPTIPVVASLDANIEVEVTTLSNCGNPLTWRLDLLLWQACDMAISTNAPVEHPTVVVDKSNNDNITLRVNTGPQLANSSEVENSSPQSSFAVFNNNSLIHNPEKTSSVSLYMERVFIPQQTQISISGNYSMVMRC